MDTRYLLHGALPAFIAACCFAGMASVVKLASLDVDSQVLVFLRSFFGLLIVAPFALRRGREFLKTTRTQLHFIRALFSIGALSCFYFAVAEIGLAEAILLNASSPLFIGILAIFMLGERLKFVALIALAIGFIGVILLLKPGTNLFQIGAMIGAMSGLFVAFAKIFIRQMADTEPVLRTVFYFGVFSSAISAVPLWWSWQSPTQFALACMMLGAIFATLGQLFLTYAFSHNAAATIAPFSYVTVAIGGGLGWFVWGELPDIYSLTGAGLIVAGCLVMLLQSATPNPWRQKASDNK